MELTEEQLKVFADFGVTLSQESQLDLLHALIAALPKPEVVEDFICRFKRHIGGDGEFWLHELEDFYTEAPIAPPASEQKPECPYPCGWENLYSLIVNNGALIVRSLDPDSVSDSTWAAISNTIEHAKKLCKHGMLPSTSPQPDYKAQLDAFLEAAKLFKAHQEFFDAGDDVTAMVKYAEFVQAIDAAIASVKGGA